MNKYYEIERSRKSNCSYMGKVESENDRVVDSFIDLICAIVAFFSSETVICIVRVISAVACFIGFIGIVGGVDAGSLSIGRGIIFSLFLLFVEIICFLPKKASK